MWRLVAKCERVLFVAILNNCASVNPSLAGVSQKVCSWAILP